MLSIGQLARQTGEKVKTLRFWADNDLLESERGENGYRYFHARSRKRVAFIRNTQSLGFKLGEIRSILELRSEGVKPCKEVRSELRSHLSAVQGRIEELRSLERELAERLTRAETHHDPKCEEGCVYLADVRVNA